jgi:hypothetical protein
MRSLLLLGLGIVTILLAGVLACSGEDSNDGAGGAGGAGAADGSAAGGGTGASIGTGGGGPTECSAAKPCPSGVCVNGICCESADKACGSSCCGGGEVCLFEQCVAPGKPCQSAADCALGQYCETALGGGSDAGTPDGGGGGKICTSVPSNGRCVELPPICDGDGGAPDGGSCLQPCEYHPPVGQLSTAKKWSWGLENPPPEFGDAIDAWATPAVGRVVDSNCDGAVDESDSPTIVFVSGDAKGRQCAAAGVNTCKLGVLRALDGRTGTTLWSLPKAMPASPGFAAGIAVALGDVDGDGRMNVVAMTGDGFIAVIDGAGAVLATSDKPHPNASPTNFGWGGGLALGDMDGDGNPEVAYGRSLWTISGATVTHLWTGAAGTAGGNNRALSFFVDLDGDGTLELLAGNTAYRKDGSVLWNKSGALPDGFNAAADFDLDGKPEVVLVQGGQVWILEGATGDVELGPITLPGTGHGGPPTVADFDGDKKPEIGVAQQNKYSMLKPDYANGAIDVVWEAPNHDLSSSVTGSSVFDFEGDGKAEVVYNDECFLWVYDGSTGKVLLAELTTSFTATEASIVADVDGDGHSEIVMVSNGADPSANGWKCDVAPWNQPDPANNRPAWVAPSAGPAYRGVTVFGDKENSWVGTRALWNQHAYSVTNVCDSRDSACTPPNNYGSIPTSTTPNWSLPWLNNFRQNVQDKGIFDAPDVTVSISVECSSPPVVQVSVRNVGLAGLPAGVVADVFVLQAGSETKIGSVTTTKPLLPGQTEVLAFPVPSGAGSSNDSYRARIFIDPNNKTFNECRDDNNQSGTVQASCGPA